MIEGDDKTSISSISLTPRRKLALILVVMLAGVFVADPSFLRESEDKRPDIQSFEEIDTFLAGFDSADAPEASVETDAPLFEEDLIADDEPQILAEEETPTLVIPSASNDVPVQMVSLPDSSEEVVDQSTSIDNHVHEQVEADQQVPTPSKVSIRLTGSIFPAP